MGEIRKGMKGSASVVVGPGDLASAYGNPGVDVASSMTLMMVMEQAALAAVAGAVEPGQMCVGTRMEMDHLAPTPEGMRIEATAEVVEMEGRKIVFKVEARDELEVVGRAVHTRYIVERARFMAGVKAKVEKMGK